jgi:hypothetical protein
MISCFGFFHYLHTVLSLLLTGLEQKERELLLASEHVLPVPRTKHQHQKHCPLYVLHYYIMKKFRHCYFHEEPSV